MKTGFTTGSCAAAAAGAAATMLFLQAEIKEIEIMTPKGIPFHAEIHDAVINNKWASCAVRKYSGDDPDVTNGTLIYARVGYIKEGMDGEIVIDGGEGVGRVTKPGLDQPVGNAAINSVPRAMITSEIKKVTGKYGYDGALSVIIYVPEGNKLAEKTFNSKLGIEGGISIIGTSGVVEPMSERALLHTIFLEMKQKKALGKEYILLTPGNYGRDFIKDEYGLSEDMSVKCSDFVGDVLDMANTLGFKGVLFVGHIGKLSKVALGVMNTHSKYGDRRMEAIVRAAGELGDGQKNEIMEAATTEEAVNILSRIGIKEKVMKRLLDMIEYHMRAKADIDIEIILYSRMHGLLAKTAGAESFVKKIKEKR